MNGFFFRHAACKHKNFRPAEMNHVVGVQPAKIFIAFI